MIWVSVPILHFKNRYCMCILEIKLITFRRNIIIHNAYIHYCVVRSEISIEIIIVTTLRRIWPYWLIPNLCGIGSVYVISQIDTLFTLLLRFCTVDNQWRMQLCKILWNIKLSRYSAASTENAWRNFSNIVVLQVFSRKLCARRGVYHTDIQHNNIITKTS